MLATAAQLLTGAVWKVLGLADLKRHTVLLGSELGLVRKTCGCPQWADPRELLI